LQDSAGKSRFAGQGDAESDAVSVFSDPGLARLIEAWAGLPDDVKGRILALAGYDINDINDISRRTHDEGAAG